MLNIYSDSGYNWKDTKDGCGTGRICIIVENKGKEIYKLVDTINISVPGLKQLNNRFELIAIQIAFNYGKKSGKKFKVYSDSKVAVGWAKNKDIIWIPREKNLAGIELDKQKLIHNQPN